MSRRNSRARQNGRIRGLSFPKRPKKQGTERGEMERRAAPAKQKEVKTPLRHRGHDLHTRLRSADDGRTSLALILVMRFASGWRKSSACGRGSYTLP